MLLCFDLYSTESIVSYLVSVNAKLLIPWLLADERPVDLCKIWPTDCSLSTIQVTAKFSLSIPFLVECLRDCRGVVINPPLTFITGGLAFSHNMAVSKCLLMSMIMSSK